jgi:hypothetical protein
VARDSLSAPFVKYLWLGVPLFALAEFGAQLHFSHQFPTVDEWRKVAPEVARLKRPGDLIVVAPSWADPMARLALGDRLMPIAESARPDDAGYARALELGAIGRSSPELADWPLLEEHTAGNFTLRVRKNPRFTPVSRVLIDHAQPPELEVTEFVEGGPRACRYNENASPSSGGLLGTPMFPRRRFKCGAAEGSFVGLTIIEDEDYRPHRCLWANSGLSDVRLTFKAVPLGNTIRGFVGLPYFMFRDQQGSPVWITTLIDGKIVGRYAHRPEQGFRSFDVPTTEQRGQIADVAFQIAVSDPHEHQVCLYADIR